MFSEAPADLMAKIGENVTLRCSAQGSPQPTVTWHRHDGREIFTMSHGRTVQLENGHLLILGEVFHETSQQSCLLQGHWYDGNLSGNAIKILLKLLLFH